MNMNNNLWDRYDMRTRMFEGSPHREVSDIWLRYRTWDEFDRERPCEFSNEHDSVWYAAAYIMPKIRQFIDDFFVHYEGDQLGGCLITKIPPGKCVYPHSDAGAWHSTYFNKKILVLLQSATGQTFEFEDEIHEGETGDIFEFDNHPVHAVYNRSDVDRISLIMAIRK